MKHDKGSLNGILKKMKVDAYIHTKFFQIAQCPVRNILLYSKRAHFLNLGSKHR